MTRPISAGRGRRECASCRARRRASLSSGQAALRRVVMSMQIEIDSEVADGPYSVILEQVANGVAVRMAVLYLLAGGAEHEAAA